MALSSNSVQPATSISDDTYLKNLGIDINDLNTNSVLKLASLFHIFANQASLSADTNGNLAVKILNGSNDFGTRGDSYNLTSGDIYYIQQLAKDLQSNAFRNKTFNHVVLGKDVNVSIENNKVLINGITMDNLKPEDVYQDTTGQTYIDFSDVFQQLISSSTSYTSTTQSKGVISNYSDMNNRYIDVSGVAAGTQIIYVNVPFEYLSDPQPITIKGISNSLTGPTIVINVTGIPDGNQNISTQVQFNYIDGTNALPNSEGHTEPNHVLWNLGTGGQTFNFSSGRFMGSILAPNATINAGVNIDGNIVANVVNITGGESHRWDIHPQPTQPTQPTQTSESQTVNETIHYIYKNGDKAADDYQATPLNFTRTVTTDKVTGEKTYGSWSADQSFAAVTSPAIKGYTPDQAEIGSQTVSGDSSDLDFTVVYAKNAPTITTESKTINETIHYVYKDGTTAHDDYVAKPVEFTREVSTDAVTGEKTYGSWSADQSFAAVTSPAIKGYTPDQAQIDTITGITADSANIEKTVTYVANKETAKVTYIDDTTGKTLSSQDLSGDYGTTDSYRTANSIKGYESQGYQLVSDNYPTNGVVYNQDGTVQSFEVHLTHGTTQTSESQTVNETIHYVYKNGDKAADDYQATPLNFTRTVTTDKVTGKKTYGSWSADQSFAAVTRPAIKGYTPDQAEIGSQTVSGDSSDLDFTVVYAKNAPTITTESKTINETIHYVYKDGTTAHDDYVAKPVEFTREVSTDAVTGEKTYGSWSADQSFAAVTSPAIKGYTPDQAEIGSQTVSGDSSDLDFTVVYAKNAPTITTESKTINETIHYVYKDGTTAHDDYVAKPVEFTREVSTDAVTGEKTYGAWSADRSFAAVTSPELKGYTADKAQIDKQTVNGDSKDLEFKVTYTKTPVAGGNVTAKYVDENGNPIADDVIASGNVGDPYSTTQKDVLGYTFKEVQGNPTGSFTDQDQTVTYVYTKNPATDNNGGTGLNQPGKPGNGTDTGNSGSNQPGNPSQPSNATNNGVINTSTNTGSKVNNGAVNSPELPQTGENNSQSQTMSFIGILLAIFGSLLGFLGIKKRRND
ncbi:MucBP domain-containing protein [Limosilactobacillus fermentum]|uniref:mucin-binding protein n=2 Tax=Limosilactobacillus fermentum TaxID=1613 RepID=UPI00272FAE76|nr:collagen-binding domain-containing protein [Limosilactobacillus fermentum]WLF75684.1 MucBP domain-containing protein [Limosilactobacillus fermentum]